ncbi:hypothetical protein GCM10027431_16730 [Lysobacter rhizosphaerae]
MSTLLEDLARRLGASEQRRPSTARVHHRMEAVLADLKKRTQGAAIPAIDDDVQERVLSAFWSEPKLGTLRDARMVTFGMAREVGPRRQCVMRDKLRFRAVLDERDGVGQWLDSPRRFRRCYQGLVRSYFAFDPDHRDDAAARENWHELRDYLSEHRTRIATHARDPEWVGTAQAEPELFTGSPCSRYAAAALEGDLARVHQVGSHLGIPDASWFFRQLVMARLHAAVDAADTRFIGYLPGLLTMLDEHPTVADEGLGLLLDRYVACANPSQHLGLREKSVVRWGNPWLPSREAAWGRVKPETRRLVGEWLKSEFVEAFFTKMATDGGGDRRRMDFWLRYVPVMDGVQFALGASMRQLKDRDFLLLKKRMEGLISNLSEGSPTNNAFIMRLGGMTIVEFGDPSHAVYGYKSAGGVPFDLDRPLGIAVDARNSLKNSSNVLRLRHQDGVHGYRHWEDRFAAALSAAAVPTPTRRRPGTSAGAATSVAPALPAGAGSGIPAYSKTNLATFANDHRMTVRDMTADNGNLWVLDYGRVPTAEVIRTLAAWGFTHKLGKGWWRK